MKFSDTTCHSPEGHRGDVRERSLRPAPPDLLGKSGGAGESLYLESKRPFATPRVTILNQNVVLIYTVPHNYRVPHNYVKFDTDLQSSSKSLLTHVMRETSGSQTQDLDFNLEKAFEKFSDACYA